MSNRVVLTASHCTDGVSSTLVYFDSEVTADYRNGEGGVEGTPFTHPDHGPNTLKNDLAVVELDATPKCPVRTQLCRARAVAFFDRAIPPVVP